MAKRSEEFGGVLAAAVVAVAFDLGLMLLRPSTICSGSGEEFQRTFVLWCGAAPVLVVAALVARWWRRLRSAWERDVALIVVFVVAVSYVALWMLAQGVPSHSCA